MAARGTVFPLGGSIGKELPGVVILGTYLIGKGGINGLGLLYPQTLLIYELQQIV